MFTAHGERNTLVLAPLSRTWGGEGSFGVNGAQPHLLKEEEKASFSDAA